MPLPKPKTDETKSEFISRCMSDSIAESEFPNVSQRVAVCQSQWDKKDETGSGDKKYNDIEYDHQYDFTQKEMEELHENGVLYVTQTDGEGTEMVIKFTYKNKKTKKQ
jgi:hypothetical protein